MRNSENWRPSKYVYLRGRLAASKDRREVGIGSRLIANLVAEYYDRYLREHAGGRLLDLGCGKVPLYAAYKDHVSRCTCVDWANSLHKNDYLDAECDLNDRLPFQAEEFDTIVLSDVLEHLPRPEYVCQEIARLLAPGGKLIMNVPFYYGIHEQPHDFYRYTEFALRRLMETSGLQVLTLESIGGTPEIITDLFAKHVAHIPIVGNAFAILAQYVTLTAIRGTPLRKLSVATRNRFPLGYFLISQKSR